MTQKTVKDYYAVLGVTQQASLEEIRLAYRRLARAFHPDLSVDPDAEERFKEVNEAYEVLANAEKRHAYDYFTAGASSEEPMEEASMPPRSPSPDVNVPGPESHRTVTAESTRAASRVAPPDGAPRRRKVYPPTWAILLIIVGGCIIVAVAAGVLLNLQRNRPTGGAESIGVTKLMTFISPPPIPADLTVIQEDNTPLRTVGPTQLNVMGTQFPVAAVLPEQGRWPLPAEQSNLGIWIHGTLINYVIGLPYTEATEALLSGLSGGDRITLTLENGTKLAFGSPQVKRVDADDTSPLVQDRPELTLLILGNDRPNRLVVKARYLPEDALPTSEQDADGLVVSVERADIIRGVDPGDGTSWFFVVEYQVTNTTGAAVDPVFFDMKLEDGRGQPYVLNADATSQGSYGRVGVPVEAGMTTRGSAGYVIPRTVTVPLVWVFKADTTSADSVRFVTSFEPPVPGPAVPDVELHEVFLDRNRDVIVVSGTVYNDGESDLRVAAEAVEMTSSAGRSSLVVSSPLLPWAVTAEGYQDFELQFEASGDEESVLLNILGFSFEIEGLAP